MRESRRVLDLILRLRDEQKAVIVVSHAMDHVWRSPTARWSCAEAGRSARLIPSAETYAEIVSLIVGGGARDAEPPGGDTAALSRYCRARRRRCTNERQPRPEPRTPNRKDEHVEEQAGCSDRPRTLVASAAAVASVTASAKPAKRMPGSVKLGFITKFPVDFYFTLVGGAKAWQKTHPNVSVMYAQGKSATDDAGEIAAIQDMVASGVKGIAITPTSAAVIPALNKAVKAGVKVVLMDNDLPTWKSKSSVVATNNLKGGVLAGKWLAGKLKAGDTLGILEGVPGVPALDDRVNGMLAGLGAHEVARSRSSRSSRPTATRRRAPRAAQTMLTANPHLTAIYSACGPPALGAIQSIKNAGIKPGGIILVGFDGLPPRGEGGQGRHRERQVAQHPDKIGSLGIATLYAAVSGKTVQKNVDTGTSLITEASAK